MNAPLAPETPRCGPTLARLQDALDGGGWAALDADPHAAACTACRGRVRAARLMLAALARPEPVAVPNFADRVLADLRPAPRRRVGLAVAGGVAIAAAVLLAVWAMNRTPAPRSGSPLREIVHAAPTEPTLPVRLDAELAKAGQAIRETTKPLVDTSLDAPKVFASIPNPFARPVPAANFEPARRSIGELPDAARAGFEPILDSGSKAFARMLRDVTAVKPKM